MHFLDFLLSKSIIINDIAYNFFKELSKDPVILQNIIFSKYSLDHMKYNVTINTVKKQIVCNVNGKYYNSYRMLNYILRAMQENRRLQVAICIICPRAPFEKSYDEVCSNIQMVEQLVESSIIDSFLEAAQEKGLLIMIDKALDDGDKELFINLSTLYKKLI